MTVENGRTTREEMTCKEVVEVITDYVEGTMSPEERRLFEVHLSECPYCQNYLEQMRDTIATLGRLPEDSLTEETRAELLAAFRGWREAQ